MNYRCSDEEDVVRCGTTTNMKDNCIEEPGEEIEVDCGSIANARCVGILAEKVFDCAAGQQSPQFADKDEEFTLTGEGAGRRGYYEEGASVCIDQIGLCYDYIGVKDEVGTDDDGGQIVVKYDSVPKTLDSVEGTEFAQECQETLYTEFEGAVAQKPCVFRTSDQNANAEAIRRRVSKGNIRFHAANLKVMISGRIGCRNFTAIKEYPEVAEITREEDPVADEGLNFSPISLYSRVSTPTDGRMVRSNIKFSPCLAVECANTTEAYSECGEGTIHANISYSFVVNSRVRHTTEEEIAVFTNPNGLECNEDDEESSCS